MLLTMVSAIVVRLGLGLYVSAAACWSSLHFVKACPNAKKCSAAPDFPNLVLLTLSKRGQPAFDTINGIPVVCCIRTNEMMPSLQTSRFARFMRKADPICILQISLQLETRMRGQLYTNSTSVFTHQNAIKIYSHTFCVLV